MFDYLRVQILHPCRAKCAWCSTHRKNPTFQKLQETGTAADIHEAYLEIIKAYPPKELFVSGGEPFLDPGISDFLFAAAEYTKTIHVFTSYQFSRKVMDRVVAMQLPQAVVLNHTPIYFEPKRWAKLTQGFPFDVYIDNIRKAVSMPLRKRFKFIVNHAKLAEEIQRFSTHVQPNETCEVSLKLMNDQGDGLVVPTMQRSAATVRERLGDLDALLTDAGWTHRKRPRGSADLMKPVIESGDVTRCTYRDKPVELRLSYAGGERGRSILKYRYCPYFPPDVGHRFHLGRDDLSKLGKNFRRGDFRDHCDRCRLVNYQPPKEA